MASFALMQAWRRTLTVIQLTFRRILPGSNKENFLRRVASLEGLEASFWSVYIAYFMYYLISAFLGVALLTTPIIDRYNATLALLFLAALLIFLTFLPGLTLRVRLERAVLLVVVAALSALFAFRDGAPQIDLRSLLNFALIWLSRWGTPLLLSAPIALLLALPPSVATLKNMRAGKPANPAQLPGISTWMLIYMGIIFLLTPGTYLWIYVFSAIPALATLAARTLTWPRRRKEFEISTFDYVAASELFGKDLGDEDFLLPAPGHYWLQSYYRFMVILGLPIGFLIYLLIRALALIPGASELVRGVEVLLNSLFSSGLGDVSLYAMDSQQANKIRHYIAEEIGFFHGLREVDEVHVLAHSQGTPITYETLYNLIDPNSYKKLKTYVTIGSVLTYYHLANPTLDQYYVPRFPVPEYPAFRKDFRWFNCWNLRDPITHFNGLDAYIHWRANGARDNASPVNVKTNTHALFTAHTEYWTNISHCQGPLAQRVLKVPENKKVWPAWDEAEALVEKTRPNPPVETPGFAAAANRAFYYSLLVGYTLFLFGPPLLLDFLLGLWALVLNLIPAAALDQLAAIVAPLAESQLGEALANLLDPATLLSVREIIFYPLLIIGGLILGLRLLAGLGVLLAGLGGALARRGQ
jgi:hypothetical protein